MRRIKVQHFGNIGKDLVENGEWLELKPFTLFVGDEDTRFLFMAIKTVLFLENHYFFDVLLNRKEKTIKQIKKKVFNILRENYVNVFLEKETEFLYESDKCTLRFTRSDVSIDWKEGEEVEPYHIQYLSLINRVKRILFNPYLVDASYEAYMRQLKYFSRRDVLLAENIEMGIPPKQQYELINYFLRKIKEYNLTLIFSTHSPYISGYVPIISKIYELNPKITDGLHKYKISQIMPKESLFNPDDIIVYQYERGKKIREITDAKTNYYNNCCINIMSRKQQNVYDILSEIEKEINEGKS